MKGSTEENAKKTLESMVLFIQESIVPLAIQTHAVVIVSGINSCSLTNAFGVISNDIRKQSGGTLPYKLICITAETPFWYSMA